MDGLELEFPEFNKKITMNYISSFELTCSIFDLYSSAHIIINDMARETYNYIKMGMDVNVTLIANDETQYTNPMKIISYFKVPEAPQGIGDVLTLDLVSSWYFENKIGSEGHLGNVGGIISNISNNFQKFFNKIEIEGTSDVERIRYQTYERSQDFMSRILKYGNVNNFPVYLFSTARGELKLKSIYNMMNASPQSVIAPDVTGTIGKMPSTDNDKERIPVNSFKFSSEGSNSNSTTYTEFTTSHFKSSQDFVKQSKLFNPESNNAQSSVATPSKYVIKNWELTPDDALSISIKENFEMNINSFSLGIVMPSFYFGDIDLGRNIKVILPFEPVNSKHGGKTNLGEGNYVIYKLSYLYKNKISNTTAKLFQATFK